MTRRGFRRGVVLRKPVDEHMNTPEEAATRLRVSVETVKAFCRRQKFPGAKKLGSNGWRIPESGLLAFIHSSEKFISTAPNKTAPNQTKNPYSRVCQQSHAAQPTAKA